MKDQKEYVFLCPKNLRNREDRIFDTVFTHSSISQFFFFHTPFLLYTC